MKMRRLIGYLYTFSIIFLSRPEPTCYKNYFISGPTSQRYNFKLTWSQPISCFFFQRLTSHQLIQWPTFPYFLRLLQGIFKVSLRHFKGSTMLHQGIFKKSIDSINTRASTSSVRATSPSLVDQGISSWFSKANTTPSYDM